MNEQDKKQGPDSSFAPSSELRSPSSKQKILIVDDRKENLLPLEKTLIETGAEMIQALSGDEALRASLNHEFALAILDVQMPIMDGFELAEFLRAEEKTRSLPIVFLTAALTEEQDVFKGYESGAVDYIIKPYNPSILLSKAEIFLELDRQRKELERINSDFLQLTLELEDRVAERTADLEREKRQAEQYLNTAGAMLAAMDADENIALINRKGYEILGYNEGELIGRNWFDTLIPERMRDEVRDVFRKLMAGDIEPVEYYENLLLTKDGEERLIAFHNTVIRNSDGQIVGTLSSGEDITERKRAEEALRTSERERSIRNRVADIFLTVPDEAMYREVLQIVLEATESKYGVFGYIGEKGDLIVPTMTWTVWDKCQVPDKKVVFPRKTWGDSTWCKAIREKKVFCSNEPSKVPEGHIPISRHISMPIVYRDESIGLLQVANKERDYDEAGIQLLQSIADYIAPVLNARLQRDRQEKARNQAEEEVRQHRDHLEKLVRERTAELRKTLNLMTGREVRMAELKEAIRKLRAQLEEAGLTPVADDPLKEGRGAKSEA